MNSINIKKFGLACGLTGAIVYLGCILVMATMGHEGTIMFFNNLLHGLDVSSIIRMDIPFWEAVVGVIETFVIAWLLGASIAAIYNISL
ncbi:hypothetical protein GCM10023188_15120 [Pontibacter saemangeumensis]|uniref:DUF4386 domain-containing protein n=1 Tax=Pontibacter saemangeumensis TaxID=1084525 RepID=A0ABP8LIS1_9BACT